MLIAKLQVYMHGRTGTCNDPFKSKDNTMQNVYIELFFKLTDRYPVLLEIKSVIMNVFQAVLAFVCLFRNVLMSSTRLISEKNWE